MHQEQSGLLKVVFDHMSDGVVAVDRKGKALIQNPAFERLVGTSVRDLTFDRWPEAFGFHYPDKATLIPVHDLPLARALRGESTDHFEAFVRSRHRPIGVYVSISARPLRNRSGHVQGAVSICRDVTRIRDAELQLRHTAGRLREQTRTMEAIFNSISDGVAVFDAEGKFMFVNPSGDRIVGAGMANTDPERWTDKYGVFFPDGVTPYPYDELPHMRALRGESSGETETFVRNPTIPGGAHVTASGAPILDSQGLVTGSVVVFRDVTERYNTAEALMRAFSRGRSEIVGTVLHNIGNAINSVAIGVGTIHDQLQHNELLHRVSAVAKAIDAHRDDPIAYVSAHPQGRQVIPFIMALADDLAGQNDRLRRIAERVQGRVTHITEIVRAQSRSVGEFTVHEDIALRPAILDSITVLQDSIDRRGIQIHVDSERAPPVIRTQENRFQQMLINLIKNAVEAIDELSGSGEHDVTPCIRITAYLRESRLVIDVADNGIGIDPSRIRRIFTPGYTTKTGGSGLGLHSAASFVLSSGGNIVPLSDGIGTGTTMRVSLRLLPTTPRPASGEEQFELGIGASGPDSPPSAAGGDW